MKKDHRGFNIYAVIKDDRGTVLRVKRSSAFGMKHLWLFSEGPDGADGEIYLGRWQSYSPHLNPRQIKQLIMALNLHLSTLEREAAQEKAKS